jgi:hypothetical protein
VSLIEHTATCRECGATWTEGLWATGERAVSRFFCWECGARPPHVLVAHQSSSCELTLFAETALRLPTAAQEAFVCGAKR